MSQFINRDKIINVLVVDDSIFFNKVLTDRLSKLPNINVVGFATNSIDAMKKIQLLKPDVITLDVEMPIMSGIEFLKKLLPIHSIPVVLVSSINMNVFDALAAGAIDFVRKPQMGNPQIIEEFIDELYQKIYIASNSNINTLNTFKKSTKDLPSKLGNVDSTAKGLPTLLLKQSTKTDNYVIAIGASTGGTEATLKVLKDLPANTPGIVVVQHMPANFTKIYAERLDKHCQMSVKEARTGDIVSRGQVLIAPGEYHMELVKMGEHFTVKCFKGSKVNGHCPSVDVLFNSVATKSESNSIGIIMTGMGRDGALGLKSMRENGAYTIGQDEASSVVYGMPMVAYNIGAVKLQTSCDKIATSIIHHINKIETSKNTL